MKRGTLTREIVIDQALKIVSENGFDRLTYNGLARTIGIQPQSMYRYVANINDVKSGVVAEFITRLTNSLTEKMGTDSGKIALHNFAKYFISYTKDGISFTEMISGLIAYRQEPLVEEALGHLREIPISLINELTSNPKMVESNSQLFLDFIIGNLSFLSMKVEDSKRNEEIFLSNIDRIIDLIE